MLLMSESGEPERRLDMTQERNTVPKLYRQGDVLVEEIQTLPDGLTPIKGEVILAYGEQTGHCHRITNRVAKFFENATGERFLSLSKQCDLKHEEHATIPLPPGKYRIQIQREYSPEAIRNVAD